MYGGCPAPFAGGNHVVRCVFNNVITTVAGTPGVSGSSGNGGCVRSAAFWAWCSLAPSPLSFSFRTNPLRSPATAALLNWPVAVIADGQGLGGWLVSDFFNNCVRRVTPGGVIFAIAGQCGAAGSFAGDGGFATRFACSESLGRVIPLSGCNFHAPLQRVSLWTPRPDGRRLCAVRFLRLR